MHAQHQDGFAVRCRERRQNLWVTRTFDYYLRRERTGKNAKNAFITGVGKGPDNVV